MKRLLSVLALVCLAAHAQTAKFPSQIATDADLKVSANFVSTKLRYSVSASQTEITVHDATNITANMLLTIEREVISVTSVSGSVLTVVRGFDGTTAAIHNAGREVTHEPTAWDVGALRAEIKAIETALGANLANVSDLSVSSAHYNFAAQSPGGSLVAGNNAVTLSPVPAGVSGTDSDHYLYVSGGTGTAEACLITGGSGEENEASGQIIINCANTHSGAWTIQSATAGIDEALRVVSAAGGTVNVPAGTHNLYAHPIVPAGVTLKGAGMNVSVLSVPAGSYAEGAQWETPGYTAHHAALVFASGAWRAQILDLTIEMHGEANDLEGGIAGIGIVYGRIENVEIDNISKTAGITTPVTVLGAADSNIIRGNVIRNLAGCASDNDGPAGFTIGGYRNLVEGNYVSESCASPYSVQGSQHIIKGNTFVLGTGTMSEFNQAYTADNGSENIFMANTCIGNGTGPACFTTTTDAEDIESNDNQFIGNFAKNCGIGYLIAGVVSNTTWSRRNSVIGNNAQGCNYGAVVQSYTEDTIIQGNNFSNNELDGIQVISNASGTIKGVKIDGNILNHNGTSGGAVDAGILINSSGSWAPVEDYLTVTNNVVRDSSSGGSKVQDYGVMFNVNISQDRVTYQNNTIIGNVLAAEYVANGWAGGFTNSQIGPNLTDNAASISLGVSSGGTVYKPKTLTLANGANNNVATGAASLLTIAGPTGAFSVTGLDFGQDLRELRIYNRSGQTMTVAHQSASSSAGNKISTPSGSDQAVTWFAYLIFDGTANSWLLIDWQ
jgi:hypothetical protein